MAFPGGFMGVWWLWTGWGGILLWQPTRGSLSDLAYPIYHFWLSTSTSAGGQPPASIFALELQVLTTPASFFCFFPSCWWGSQVFMISFYFWYSLFSVGDKVAQDAARLASSPMADSQIYFIFMIVSITNNHARFAVFRINSNDTGHGCFLNEFDRLQLGYGRDCGIKLAKERSPCSRN